ncbi:MAG: DNA polymerase III subunit alpha [bacterium]
MKFTHLHTHSHYSLLDGLAKIPNLVAKAKIEGMDSLALTDHGVMYGVVEFFQACKKNGLKPIIGAEVYLSPRGRLHKESGVDIKPYHLVLLVKNETGYRNLLKLVSIAHLEGFYYKPRVDWEILEKYGDGLIALSACLQGELPVAIQRNEPWEKITALARRYDELFGPGNFFLEVQHHPGLANQQIVNEKIITLGKQRGIPVVATNDIHYLNQADAEAHDILLCLQTKKKKEDKDRLSMLGEDFSFRSTRQMINDFHYYPPAIANTQLVVDACNFELPLGKVVLPSFELPAGLAPEQYLRDLAEQGLVKRFEIIVENQQIVRSALSAELTRQIIDRLEYELGIIAKTGFSAYLLIVQDFVNWAKSQNILVGPGRGSAAGSLVSYLINITNVDPIKYDLLFERFLNPERISLPDIDLDFADTRRDEVIRYVESKYGQDHVAQIITFGTMAARAAVRDVGRVLNLPYAYCDQTAKLIPLFTNLDKALATVPDLKQLYQNDPQAKKLLDTAKVLEGVARHASTHACGVLITPERLDNYVPLQYASSGDQTIVSQYSLHPIEDLGLLKMDFLGLANLSILENALARVEKVHGLKIDLDQIPFDDELTFKLLQRADTVGVFQLESAGLRRYLKELKPTVFEDVIAMVALYRPGPMEWIPDFIAGKHGLKEVSYIHPKLKPILSKTYGVAVYQEQVMQITRDLAGFSLGEADILRKAVGKKIPKLLIEQKEKFIKNCVRQGVSQSIAERVFAFMEPFAGYGFNRAHAACYAVIAYQTAYLKAHYPTVFMASLMTADQGNSDRIAIEVEECRRLGIEVLPPDINESYSTFTAVKITEAGETPRIRFGLLAIKNLGVNVVKEIISERKANGPYLNLEDLLKRVKNKDLNKKSLESLVKAGALDRFGERNQFFLNMERLLGYLKNLQRDSTNGQANLFGADNGLTALVLESVAPAPKRQYLAWEKELLGLYVSEHPLSEFSEQLKGRVVACVDLGNLEDSQVNGNGSVRVAGVITKIQRVITKANEVMLFVKIEDASDGVEVLVFPKILVETHDVWQEGRIVIIQGRLSDKDGTIKILVQTAAELTLDNLEQCLEKVSVGAKRNHQPLAQPAKKLALAGTVCLTPVTAITPALAQNLKMILIHYPGRYQVCLVIKGNRIKTNSLIDYNEEVKSAIEGLLGPETVKLDS